MAGRTISFFRPLNVPMRTRLKRINGRAICRRTLTNCRCASPSRTTRFIRHANYSSLTITVNGRRKICASRPRLGFRIIGHMHSTISIPLILRNTSKVDSTSVGATVSLNVTGVGVRARLYRTTVITIGRGRSRPFLRLRHRMHGTMGRQTLRGVGLFNSSNGTRW